MGLVMASLPTSCAATVRECALQRGSHARAATKTTRLAKTGDKAMIVDARVACMRRDGRRWTMASRSLRETHSEGRDVKTTGGAHARHGVYVGFGGRICPTPNDADDHQWRGVIAGDGHARRAQCGFWCMEKTTASLRAHRCVHSDRSVRCRDGMVRQAKESVGAGVFLQFYGSGGYSDRSSRCQDAMGCSSQQDGALAASAAQRGRQSAWTG